MLRKRGVVGKFVEFGPGLAGLTIADRATLATWRPNTARPAASSRSTTRSSICATLAVARTALLPRLRQGAGRTARRRRLIRSSPMCSSPSASVELSSPAQASAGSHVWGGQERLRHRNGEGVQQGRRRGGKDVFELHPSIATAPLDKNFAKAGTPRRWSRPRSSRPRRCGDRRDYVLHQHLELA